MAEHEEEARVVADVERFVEMTHQVGGHATAKTMHAAAAAVASVLRSTDVLCVSSSGLKSYGGKILKPFQNKRRGEREHEFYEQVFRTECANSIFEQLRPLIPGYHGMVVIPTGEHGTDEVDAASTGNESRDGKHLVMDDLTWGRHWPCIMDVKVGTRSYEDGASAEKTAYEKQKFPLQELVGFRIQGIKVFDPAHQQYIELDKHFGRQVRSQEGLIPAFGKFFMTHEGDKRKNIVLLKAFLSRLELLRAWFDEQQELEFIASSLLFLYNGKIDDSTLQNADGADDADYLALTSALAADIRLIDFAHVMRRPSDALERDEGVRKGIRTIIHCFQELLKQLHSSQAQAAFTAHSITSTSNFLPSFRMGVDMQFRPAVHPLRPLQTQSVRINIETTQNEQFLHEDRALWQREFQALLQKYEPERAHQAPALLRVYAGMEYELLQCYRHHYTGKGGFRISTSTTTDQEPLSSSTRHTSGIFSLPKAAIATYLREKRRARSRSIANSNQSTTTTNNNSTQSSSSSNLRSNRQVSMDCSKGDDIRSPEMPLLVSRTAPVVSSSNQNRQQHRVRPSASIIAA